MASSVGRARLGITAIGERPEAGSAFATPVMQALGAVVGFDGCVLLGMDPESGLRSFMFCRDGVGDPRQLARNEWDVQDVHRYVDLAQAQVPVGVLSERHSAVAWSPRLQEILSPAGVTSELRLALRDRRRLWGALVLFRADGRRPFSSADAATVLDLAGPLTTAVRRYSVRRQRPSTAAPTAGVVVLGPDDEIVSSTGSSRAWLTAAVAGGMDEDRPGRVHRAVYEVARAVRLGAPTPISRIRTSSGRWLAVTGERLDGKDQVAVVLAAATVEQVVPAAALWYGLTPRECEVLAAVLGGASGKTAARKLHLSSYTVEDHLTAIYRKTGAAGKDDLLADLASIPV